jgi:hypothetical protein
VVGPAGTRTGPCDNGMGERELEDAWRTAGWWIDDLTLDFVAMACAHAIRIVGCNFPDNDRYVRACPGLEN